MGMFVTDLDIRGHSSFSSFNLRHFCFNITTIGLPLIITIIHNTFSILLTKGAFINSDLLVSLLKWKFYCSFIYKT